MPVRISIVLTICLFLGAACGGGSGGNDSGLTLTQAPAVSDGEGYVLLGGASDNTAPSAPVGDNVVNTQSVAVFCFDVTALEGLQSATLRLHAISSVGAPWPLAPLLIDHVDGGGLLDAADGNGGTLDEAFDILAIGAEWAVNVTSQVQADRDAGRDISTFRIRYTLATNANNGLDYLFLATSKHPDGAVRPVLELIYTQ